MSEADTPDCPLCMETFEIDDLHFYPCTCGYQICRFCWHRIRTDENGLCPACRKPYSEDPAMYRPPSQDEIQKIKKERKQKDAQHKQKISANRQHLSNIRVIQKHLVFVVGLSNKMADADILKRPEYFGKYGKIMKIVINPNTNYAGPQGPSASAYITYTKEQDALKAILSINNTQPPLKIRASLGTTKYCTHYLRNQACPKMDCMYLHDVGESDASFTKEDMQEGKHQLFEKNLLDNYVASMQQHRKLQKSISETSEPDPLETQVPEDWSEEVENADSLLPSQASWGSSKEHMNSIQPAVEHEVEYPELEPSCKIAPKPSPPLQQTSIQPPVKVEAPPLPVAAHLEDKPLISSGWTESSDRQPEIAQTDPTTTAEATNYSWPSISDLGLSDLKINPSDDELGFDPFTEIKSGLEDLMESEKKQGVPTATQPTPSFSWDSFWPTNYAANQNPMSLLTSYSLFGAQQRLANPHMMSYRPPSVNPYQSQVPPNPLHMTAPNSTAPFRFPQQPMQRFPSQPIPPSTTYQNPTSPVSANPLLAQQQQLHNQQFLNQYRFNQPVPPSQLPPVQIGALAQQLATSTTSSTDTETTINSAGDVLSTDKNWQDGLRALLPNINISFSSQQIDLKFADGEPVLASDSNSTITTPPPGFGGFGLPMKLTEKASRPAPPPGFSKPAGDVFSSTAQPPPGILNIPAGLQLSVSHVTTTPVVAKPSQVNTATTHDDPSILWSKLLSDRRKEMETSEMAFPLPGESLNQASSSLPNQPTQILNLTSWNTIVSGNQVPTKILQKPSDDDILNQQHVPLQISAHDIDDGQKPQKPSPIFGNQQKLAVKKPTAHVKPLKQMASDGFTTVQNSRQPVLNSNLNTGSRVSELDDFSADFMGASSSGSVVGNVFSIGASIGATSMKTSNKKKKKKNKEQVEHVSEIIVGRVEAERPPVAILDEERPKKGGKTKKKGSKQSPPQQRKSPPLLPTFERQSSKEQAAPTIRILKTDSNNSGVTTSSPPVQTVACGGSVVPDHEIVSRLTESTEKLLKNVLFETEAIKSNTEQISKDLKSALEKCKESSLSLSDLEKINLLLTPGKLQANDLDDSDVVDTSDLERQVESARREAKMLEARLNDVIRKNMASELETLKRNTKSGGSQQ